MTCAAKQWPGVSAQIASDSAGAPADVRVTVALTVLTTDVADALTIAWVKSSNGTASGDSGLKPAGSPPLAVRMCTRACGCQ